MVLDEQLLDIGTLRQCFAGSGRIESVWLRPHRGQAALAAGRAFAHAGVGLEGDHYRAKNGARQLTLLQHEHLAVIGSLLGPRDIFAGDLRRNVVVSGINLTALQGHRVRVGGAIIELSGACQPCSRMESILGHGAYNAMRGHGGFTARIVESGWIAQGDEVSPVLAS